MNEKDYFDRLKNTLSYCRGCELRLKNEKQEKAYTLIKEFDKWLKETDTGFCEEDFKLEEIKNKWEELKNV